MDGPVPQPLPAEENAASDKRDDQRVRTVCRFAKILRADDAGLWLVRNISNGGMMLSTQAEVEIGEEIVVAFSDAIEIGARIVWVKDGKCGVAFTTDIDGPTLLKQLAAEQQARGYRQPRIPLQTIGRVKMPTGWQIVEITNLSQQGAGFLHDGTVKVGTQVELVLGRIARKAVVRWSRGHQGGLWLTQPIDRSAMESIRSLQTPVGSV
jgi:hypothetical protein